jgi:S-methyl-5-thioribose-1-phosphate isomerase
MEGRTVCLIDQNQLPFRFKIFRAKTSRACCAAIKDMTVRGAGAIGAAAAFAMAQVFWEAPEKSFWLFAARGKKEIEHTRPTAKNLFHAVDRVFRAAQVSDNPKDAAVQEAQNVAADDVEACRAIGRAGAKLIKNGAGILTHCNAGWLAFVDYGSALAPIYVAARSGKKNFVYVDETRPRGQGARLTAWELRNERIPHAVIADNAAAHFMSQGKIGLVIVGADRIARNGDTANKIGTLEKAILAKEFGIPFYVAAPLATFDLKCKTGKDIPIEARDAKEVLYQTGLSRNGKTETIRVASPGSAALNPAFDVTPAKYISGIITEKGIMAPTESNIKKLFLG